MAQEHNGKPQETQVEFLASLASTLVMVLFIMTFIGQTFAIPSSSMENTLLIGDHLFVNRIGFAPRSAMSAGDGVQGSRISMRPRGNWNSGRRMPTTV